MKIYKLSIPMRRGADLVEVAVVTDEQWESIREHDNAELYLGEIAGKHSEVRWTLDMHALDVLTADPGEIALFKKWFPTGRIGQVNLLGALERLHDVMEPGDADCMCGKQAPREAEADCQNADCHHQERAG